MNAHETLGADRALPGQRSVLPAHALGLMFATQQGVVEVLAAVSDDAFPRGGFGAAIDNRAAITDGLEVQQFQDTCV